jgi:hypothetical protein
MLVGVMHQLSNISSNVASKMSNLWISCGARRGEGAEEPTEPQRPAEPTNPTKQSDPMKPAEPTNPTKQSVR